MLNVIVPTSHLTFFHTDKNINKTTTKNSRCTKESTDNSQEANHGRFTHQMCATFVYDRSTLQTITNAEKKHKKQ